jgi:hypothetical protein
MEKNIFKIKTDSIDYTIREVDTPRKEKITQLIIEEIKDKFKYIDVTYTSLVAGYAEEI